MPLQMTKIQEYKNEGPGLTPVLIKENLAIRFMAKGEAPLWIQNGKVWPEGRNAPAIQKNDLPDWFLKAAAAVDPKKLEKCNFELPKNFVKKQEKEETVSSG